MQKAKKKPEVLRELWDSRIRKQARTDVAAGYIAKLHRDGQVIESVGMVTTQLNEAQGNEYKPHQVRKVMRESMHLSFKNLSPVDIHTNSNKNLILRQRFAMELVDLLNKGKTILNVDESWLGVCDYRRRIWSLKGEPSSVIQHQVVPRISMIVGLDTTGAVYLSLL